MGTSDLQPVGQMHMYVQQASEVKGQRGPPLWNPRLHSVRTCDRFDLNLQMPCCFPEN